MPDAPASAISPAMRRRAWPDAYCSRHPCRPQPQGRPSRHQADVPELAADTEAAAESSPPAMIAPPTPVPSVSMAMSGSPRRHRSGTRPNRRHPHRSRSRRDVEALRIGRAAARRARRCSVRRRPVLRSRSMKPAAATPTRPRIRAVAQCRDHGRRRHSSSRVGSVGGVDAPCPHDRAGSSTKPPAILVPPMSMPIASTALPSDPAVATDGLVSLRRSRDGASNLVRPALAQG